MVALATMLGWGVITSPTYAAPPVQHEFVDRTKTGCTILSTDTEQFLRKADHCLKVDRDWWALQIIKKLGPHRTRARNYSELREEFSSDTYALMPCQGSVFNDGFREYPDKYELVGVPRRECYVGERMLVYAPPGPRAPFAVVSDTCLNPQEVPLFVSFIPQVVPMRTYGIDETCPRLGWGCIEHNREIGSGWNMSEPTPQSMLRGAEVYAPYSLRY